jgi:peroxiredoxin
MMRKTILALVFAVSGLALSAQDPVQIMKKSYEKCQSVTSGYYEMTNFMKYMTGKDTTRAFYSCYFKKLAGDTLYSSAFHYTIMINGQYLGDVLYTGSDFVTTQTKDSTATIMATAKWAKEIRQASHNYIFYTPLTNRKSIPMPHDSDFRDKSFIFKYIGEENIGQARCYHIGLSRLPEKDPIGQMNVLRIEYNFWISSKDYIPLQFTTAFDMVMKGDTMHQFEKKVITRYELNRIKDENVLTLKSIPAYYKLKDYVPYKNPKPLANGTQAPAWEFPSLTGQKVSLAGLTGKLVLVDFFYKSCYPCMQAMPSLEKLSRKYGPKGLEVVGIDGIDAKEDLKEFLAKRGVTYTVLLGSKEIAKEYHVSGYPTMYLIDGNGKILHCQQGFGEGVESLIEAVIQDNLPK